MDMTASGNEPVHVSYPSPRRMLVKTVSHPATLAPVRKQVEAFSEKAGFDFDARGQIVLVVNEAMANVMRHAYRGASDRPIEVSAEDTGDALRIDVRDWGSGVTPDCQPTRQFDPTTPGGLGLICLRQFMDEVKFNPQPDGMQLTMIRRKKRAG
jgi:serine/threonine-protein kinase RsbW